MEDLRCFDDGCLWIWVILAFILLSGCKCNSLLNFDCLFGNIFDGCSSSWLWILIAFLVYWFLIRGNCGCGIFRNDMQ